MNPVEDRQKAMNFLALCRQLLGSGTLIKNQTISSLCDHLDATLSREERLLVAAEVNSPLGVALGLLEGNNE